ncbi:putative P-loop containing nucleoside triphosphate hydrolase, leucine-rich repeat domain, L [Rosa chinensis]|uniref:Putative P-loop containing nucleoside triphosphate hydrolase, leucine-rich repeat domain, L n=1 Tax=Rosa chinensis TaxID=74649 RepID=A0A2P6QDM1_ROSCH|nr:putative disease resistance RPP13-like protein 1 [Rosa chinensis]PRQ32285.1 putative P-loop containing nucleoside triphosphate hydrolase, leucine-rich repeat domain, L [Rosa chinensis]
MALEIVGGAFLSSALGVLFDRMASRPVVDFIRGKKITAGLLHKLKIKLLLVNKLLDDAEEKQLRNSRVREWLDELKDVLYHADDLLDEIKTEALRCKMEQEDSGSSSTNQVLKFSSISIQELDKSLEPRILDVLDRLEVIVNEKDVLDLKEGVQDRPQARLPTTSLVEESSVYGRDEEKEAIIKLLLADGMTGNKKDVLPIVGMGGVGKTTLAQLVYNDDRVKQHFDHQSWSCVSEEFDVIKITQTIYGAVTSQTCNITDLDMLQVKLKQTLSGKKFLFVLDDVWNVNLMKWDLLSRPFEGGGHGSKIIVTTRDEGAACRMGTVPSKHLVQLSEENCWLLFSKHAFKNAGVTADPSHEVIGKQIAQKCKGLPLAAKSLGGLLCSEPNIEKWEEILNNDIWELRDKENDILPALWLSYHYLPPHLKRCFAYCSIFPQDHKFNKPDLVLLWMAEDLLSSKSKTTIEEVGDNYFDDLVSRSFFQPDHFSGKPIFTMHDLIHDLANFVSGEFCVRLEDNDPVLENAGNSRHFSCVTGSFDQWDSLYEAKYLRTFLVVSDYINRPNLDFDIFLKLQCLRMLNLSGYRIGELPSSISKLKHLRHLDLSDTSIKKLPDEMCTLYNLQTLLLSYCYSLVELPTDFGRLINLRHLDIRYTQIEKMPPRMGKMKDLQTLRGKFVLDKYTGDNIVEIKGLQQLRGTLCISGLRHILHVTDALETNMRKKKHLDELVLEWGGKSGDTDDTQKERDVLENLQPHTNLKELTVRSYGGTRFPGWLEDHSSLSNLVRLQLLDCGNCWLLASVEQLPSLQELEIEGFNGVVNVGSKPFPNLRKLSLRSCPKVTRTFILACFPKLESLELKDVNVESLSSSTLLSLVKLSIASCPNFVCFPDGGLNAPNLETIAVHTCLKLRSLPQHMHNLLPSLRRLFVYCPELESFPEGRLPSKLEYLGIWRCKKLLIGNPRMQWGLPTLTSLKFLSVGFQECEHIVDSFPDEGLLPTTLSRLEIYSISKLDGKGFRQLTSLKEMEIGNCPELRCLPDEGLPTSLSDLNIYDCPLLEQRCQRETGEDWPKIAHIKSIRINNKEMQRF